MMITPQMITPQMMIIADDSIIADGWGGHWSSIGVFECIGDEHSWGK